MPTTHPEKEAISRTASAVSEPRTARKYDLELDNGIVLAVTPVPQLMLRDAVSKLPPPPVPMWHNDARDEDEPNPNDPAYLEALEQHALQQFLVAGNAAMVLGTRCLSVPEGMWRPEEDDWIDWVQFAGGQPDVSSKPARYLSWLHFHALRTPSDQSLVVMAPLLLANLSEEEVARSVDSFRRGTLRGFNQNGIGASPDSDGDHVPGSVPGDRAGDGGAGGGDVRVDPVPPLAEDDTRRTRRRRRALPAASPG